MLMFLATYALPILLALTVLIVGPCVYFDIRNGYVSNPFNK